MKPYLLVGLILAAGLAVWANLPEHDPWSDVPPGQPHPRIGARVTIAPLCFVHLPPMELTPRLAATPSHWRSTLANLDDAQLSGLLPEPDQEESGPDGKLHRFWNSLCPAEDASTQWVAHLWTESRSGKIIAVHVVGGGGVLLNEAGGTLPPSPGPPPGALNNQ